MNARTIGVARNLSFATALLTVLSRSSTAGGSEPSLPTRASEAPAAIPFALFLGDVDEDGLDDAVVIGQDGRLALLHNRGRGMFEDLTLPSGSANVEGASCALLADFDGDGHVGVGTSAPNAYCPGAQREIVVIDTDSGAVASLAVAGDTTQPALDPRGERLVLFESDATGSELIEHDTATMTQRRRVRLPIRGRATYIEYAQGGRWFAVGLEPRQDPAAQDEFAVLIVDATSWDVLRRRGQGAVGALALTSDGQRIAQAHPSPGRAGALSVWSVDDGRCVARRERVDVMGSAVTFSPDGARIATGRSGAFVNIWDAVTLDPLARLEEHKDYVLALDWCERARAPARRG